MNLITYQSRWTRIKNSVRSSSTFALYFHFYDVANRQVVYFRRRRHLLLFYLYYDIMIKSGARQEMGGISLNYYWKLSADNCLTKLPTGFLLLKLPSIEFLIDHLEYLIGFGRKLSGLRIVFFQWKVKSSLAICVAYFKVICNFPAPW
jgi:hypothetical protein